MRRRAVLAVALILLTAAPAMSGQSHRHFDNDYTDDEVAEPSDSEGHRDFDRRSHDTPLSSQQQPPPMQPYWGTMRPYWNAGEPPGVIHRGARTRGFNK